MLRSTASPLYIFRHYETVKNSHFSFFFMENFQCLRRVAPSFFFDILQQTGFSKTQRVPPSTILKTLRFLSLGYGADFRRSRLVNFSSFLLFSDKVTTETGIFNFLDFSIYYLPRRQWEQIFDWPFRNHMCTT